MDFGLEMDSEEQLRERREAVEAVVAGKTGWEGDGGPKAFFELIKRQMVFVQEGGDRTGAAETNWNMRITGNPGTGKTTFARLVHKFMYAYGALSKEVCSETSSRPPTEVS